VLLICVYALERVRESHVAANYVWSIHKTKHLQYDEPKNQVIAVTKAKVIVSDFFSDISAFE
jgi:hypothetical protein